jgi:hypothetical protein
VPLCGEHEIGEIELIRFRDLLEEMNRDEATDALNVETILERMVRVVIETMMPGSHTDPALPLAQQVLSIPHPNQLPTVINYPGPVTKFMGIDNDGADGTTETSGEVNSSRESK